MATGSELIRVEHVTKKFKGGVVALNDCSLSISRGEVVAIIGPSGSGKSTLLRCATTLEKIDGGTIAICGRALASNVNGKEIFAGKKDLVEIRSMFGLVFQNFHLFPHFSVRRNITESLIHVRKVPKAEANAVADRLLAKMGLSEKADAYPCQLSGGQQQRVSIARALAINPEILFFDEPTSALDPELTGEILKVIRELAEEKMTMVIVTHEMSFARDVADRAIFMDQGRIVEQGPAKSLFANPQQPRTRQFLEKFLMQ